MRDIMACIFSSKVPLDYLRTVMRVRFSAIARKRASLTTAVVLVLLILFAHHSPAGMAHAADQDIKVVKGTPTQLFASVGALLRFDDDGVLRWCCTGTLIAPRTFLTAAHCVASNSIEDHYAVYFQHAGIFSVRAIEYPHEYSFPADDIAVVTLEASVSGIAPIPISDVADVSPGTRGWIVGFGRTEKSRWDGGIKRVGSVIIGNCAHKLVADCDSTRIRLSPDHVCWDYDGRKSNTCKGDSGGPLFVLANGSVVVGGVTSGGQKCECLIGDQAFNTRVSSYVRWIEDIAGSDMRGSNCEPLACLVCDPAVESGRRTTSCEYVPEQVVPGKVSVFTMSGALTRQKGEAACTFAVRPRTRVLCVTINAVEEDGTGNLVNDFDLYLRQGKPPTPTNHIASAVGPGQFGAITISSPGSGDWYLLVQRLAGEGEYQVTCTTYLE